VIAAITSCTNTSNPSLMMAAGLLARNALARGLVAKPWVKTSLAPESRVVADYLERAGLRAPLEALGFHVVGFGCTTCNGMSGPLPALVAAAIDEGNLVCAAVVSGNRNFEGRIHPQVRAGYLASPPLVVAYAIAGSVTVDLVAESLGLGADGNPVFLRDIWPDDAEIAEAVSSFLAPSMFTERYATVFEGDADWQALNVGGGTTYAWDPASTYLKRPPYFDGMAGAPEPPVDIHGARALAILGDSVSTDHISPSGVIHLHSPAGRYLVERGVAESEFNSYGTRRGNHEVGMRATFAGVRLRNEMVPGVEGGVTRLVPDGETLPIFDAAMRYGERSVPLVVVAGREYGCGSSRDWAAKGPRLLGVAAVIAESFERIHRSNLVGMGVLPLQFAKGVDRKTLGLDGSETFDVAGIAAGLKPGAELSLTINRADGSRQAIVLECRIDTEDELACYLNGGILPYVLRGYL